METPSDRSNFGLNTMIRKSRVHNGNEHPIFFRVTLNGQRAEFATKLYIKEADWDNERKKAKGFGKTAKQINDALVTAEMHIRSTYINLVALTTDGVVTLDRLRDAVDGVETRRSKFLELYEKHVADQKDRIGVGYVEATYSKTVTTFGHMKAFINDELKKQDIYVSELDFIFVEKFYVYITQKVKQSLNTSARTVQRVQAFVNLLVKRGVITKDPFSEFSAPREKTETLFLTSTELLALENKVIGMERLDYVKDLFVFSCYTGLAFIDMQKLKTSDIETGPDGRQWIVIHRHKTGVRSDIPIFEPAQLILDKYAAHPILKKQGKILPTLSNQKMNAYLKEIAELCGIHKNITSHLARHTFATTVTLANAVSIESVSRMLGHTNIKTTQIYAKVAKTKIATDTNHLHGLFARKDKPEEAKSPVEKMVVEGEK